MSTPANDSLKAEIDLGVMKVGNQIRTATGLPASASTLIYADSSSNLAAGAIPFAIATNASATSNSVLSIEGQATGTANDLMHLTLVSGANATATIAGYYRVTVTDDAGVITSGAYYAPFYTLA